LTCSLLSGNNVPKKGIFPIFRTKSGKINIFPFPSSHTQFKIQGKKTLHFELEKSSSGLNLGCHAILVAVINEKITSLMQNIIEVFKNVMLSSALLNFHILISV
jgi:hypothetical protein